MSDAPERPQDQRQQHAALREESVLPIAAEQKAERRESATAARRTALRVIVGTIAVSVLMSTALEYAGWQIAFDSMPIPRTPIPLGPFFRGVWDTNLGAMGLGAAGVVAAMLLPSSWKNAWRRVPAAFAMGAAAFLGFISFVTLSRLL